MYTARDYSTHRASLLPRARKTGIRPRCALCSAARARTSHSLTPHVGHTNAPHGPSTNSSAPAKGRLPPPPHPRCTLLSNRLGRVTLRLGPLSLLRPHLHLCNSRLSASALCHLSPSSWLHLPASPSLSRPR